MSEEQVQATIKLEKFSRSESFKTVTAILVSVFAMILAITSIGSSNASGDATDSQIAASNAYAFYQAKAVRQADYKLFTDQLNLQKLEFPSMPKQAQDLIEKHIQLYSSNIQRYESEPETGEGKKELLARAKHFEELRSIALRKDPWFDYAEGFLQVAIVLASVAIVTSMASLLGVSFIFGLIGAFCSLNGFFLFL